MSNKQRIAACALVIKDGKVLSVSRKDNPNDFGLPGGRAEDWEYIPDAAIRELKEETGLIAIWRSARTPQLVHEGYSSDGWYTYTYLITEWEGDINTTEAGKIAWLSPEELMTNSSFSAYNRAVFEAIGLVENETTMKAIISPKWDTNGVGVVLCFLAAAIIAIVSLIEGLHRDDYIGWVFYALAIYGSFMTLVSGFAMFKYGNEG